MELNETALLADGLQPQLSITQDAKFNTLTLISSSDFSQDESNQLNLNSVFGDNTSVVMASMQNNGTNLTVVDSNNQEWTTKDLNYGGGRHAVV